MRDSRTLVPNAVAALWCKFRGHRWQPVLLQRGHAPSVCMVCLRCRENAWLLS